jgi:hypothetical protein
MRNVVWWIAGAWLSVAVSVAACSKHRGDTETPASPSPEAASSSASAPVAPPISLMHASAVVRDCPDAKWMHTGAAHKAIQKVIDPCIVVPGGKAHFSASLLPGGRIELASPTGDPDQGVVPTCVLKNQNLRHQVFLKHACAFDVVLEERPEVAPPAASAE